MFSWDTFCTSAHVDLTVAVIGWFSLSLSLGYGGFDNYNGFNNYCFGNGMFDDRLRGGERGGRGKGPLLEGFERHFGQSDRLFTKVFFFYCEFAKSQRVCFSVSLQGWEDTVTVTDTDTDTAVEGTGVPGSTAAILST